MKPLVEEECTEQQEMVPLSCSSMLAVHNSQLKQQPPGETEHEDSEYNTRYCIFEETYRSDSLETLSYKIQHRGLIILSDITIVT